jgi:DNA invertase Pin-like site-specific DNA recombinase
MEIGYERKSTVDQSFNLQTDALKMAGCELIFSDTWTGKKSDRPELDKLFTQIRKGDRVTVWKLDRLGRSVSHLIQLIKRFEEMGVTFRCLHDNIDTSTPQGKLYFHFFAALAEYEASLIRERTMAGLTAARSRGRVGGRPKGITPEILEKSKVAKSLFENKSLPIAAILKHLNVSRTSFYKLLKL